MNNLEKLELILSRYVVIFGGRYSRGKSLSLCALNFFDMVLNKRHNIISNMPIKYNPLNADVMPLIQTSQFDNMTMHTNYIWDEIHYDLNARAHQSSINKYINVFGRDVAKIDGRLRGSLQFFDTLEKVIGLLLEVTIIPEYVNKYSDNTKKDNIIRLEKKDFLVKWYVSDKREMIDFDLTLQLYPFIFMYNTKYKTMPLFINHAEYIEKLQFKKREFEYFENHKIEEVLLRSENWNNGILDIGKELIR